MRNGSIEKAVALTRSRIVLGAAPVPVRPDTAAQADAEIPASTVAQPAPSEFDIRLAEYERRIAGLEEALASAQEKEAQSRAAFDALQRDIDALRTDAQREGFAAGVEEGEHSVQAQWREQAEQWQQGLIDLAAQQEQFCVRLSDSLTDLVLASAVKILGEKLVDAAGARAALEHVIAESGLNGPLTVRVAPAQYEALMRARGEAERTDEYQILPDSRVAYGGCLLDSDGTVVDGRYEIQLRKLRDIMGSWGADLS